jgi:hypothetical protein
MTIAGCYIQHHSRIGTIILRCFLPIHKDVTWNPLQKGLGPVVELADVNVDWSVELLSKESTEDPPADCDVSVGTQHNWMWELRLDAVEILNFIGWTICLGVRTASFVMAHSPSDRVSYV